MIASLFALPAIEPGTIMTSNQTCGQAAIALLERYGVDTVFGIPGVHTLELYRGLADSRIRHIAVRHEQGAGFMADGYARASGRPGVCVLITGPGMTNAATPIGLKAMRELQTLNPRPDTATDAQIRLRTTTEGFFKFVGGEAPAHEVGEFEGSPDLAARVQTCFQPAR